MQINNFLENSARQFPDKQAVWYQGQWKTYSEMDTMANKIANQLVSLGIKRGDRIAILYKNSFEYIAAYFGILKAGGVTVALTAETTCDAVIYALNNSGARAIITESSYSEYLLGALGKTHELAFVIIDQKDVSEYVGTGDCSEVVRLEDVFENGDGKQPDVKCVDIDLASIVYTSGSTGKPKGVMLTHLNVVSNTISITKYLKLTGDDRILVILPFYYIYGQSLLTTHFYVGGSLVIENRLVYPQIALGTMRDTEVTGLAGVPSTFLILVNRTNVREFEFPALRYVMQAGGAMAVKTQKEVAKVFSEAEVFIMYGATEAAPRLCYVPPEKLHEKWGSIGIPLDNVEVFVADDHGRKLGAGEEGEIVARGSNIMAGYWRDAQATAEVLKHGLYFTGDKGVTDEDGYIFVVGRKKDIIKSGGFRISSKEIEEALLENDDIHEAAVIGVVDEIFGEAIKAFIVPKSGIKIGLDAVKKQLKKLLPPFKHPKYFEISKSLPKNESGKIMKATLVEKEKSAEIPDSVHPQ